MEKHIEKIKELETAKENVFHILENPHSLVDFHDIVYRATRVKELREELLQKL